MQSYKPTKLTEYELPPINICRNTDIILESMLTLNAQQCVKLRRLTENEVNALSKNAVLSILAKAKQLMMNTSCFADISKTKGDVSKHGDYKNFNESLKVMNRIKSLPVSVKDSVNQLENVNKFLIKNRSIFQNAFKEENLNLVMFYNTLVVNMLGAGVVLVTHVSQSLTGNTSYANAMVSTLGEETFTTSLSTISTKIQDGTAQAFLQRSANGKTDELKESFALPALFALAIGILWYIRDVVYYLYQLRYDFSKWLRSYGEFLKLRSYSLETQNKAIAGKQLAVAKTMLDLADTIAVETKSATISVAKEIRSDNNKITNGNASVSVSGISDDFQF